MIFPLKTKGKIIGSPVARVTTADRKTQVVMGWGWIVGVRIERDKSLTRILDLRVGFGDRGGRDEKEGEDGRGRRDLTRSRLYKKE